MAATTFISSLEQVVMAIGPPGDHVTDSVTHHHWLLPQNTNLDTDWSDDLKKCMCGAVEHMKDARFTYIGRSHDRDITGVSNAKVDWEKCDILDLYEAMAGAFRTGVAMATMILGIEHSVKDTN